MGSNVIKQRKSPFLLHLYHISLSGLKYCVLFRFYVLQVCNEKLINSYIYYIFISFIVTGKRFT